MDRPPVGRTDYLAVWYSISLESLYWPECPRSNLTTLYAKYLTFAAFLFHSYQTINGHS